MFRDSASENLGQNVSILRATREPCLVCGHPTGDCTGDSPPPLKIAGLNGVIETLKEAQTVLVEEDVYEDRQITPFTKARVIIHHKGSYVTLDVAKNLGIA
jgi:hypothetical protein